MTVRVTSFTHQSNAIRVGFAEPFTWCSSEGNQALRILTRLIGWHGFDATNTGIRFYGPFGKVPVSSVESLQEALDRYMPVSMVPELMDIVVAAILEGGCRLLLRDARHLAAVRANDRRSDGRTIITATLTTNLPLTFDDRWQMEKRTGAVFYRKDGNTLRSSVVRYCHGVQDDPWAILRDMRAGIEDVLK